MEERSTVPVQKNSPPTEEVAFSPLTKTRPALQGRRSHSDNPGEACASESVETQLMGVFVAHQPGSYQQIR